MLHISDRRSKKTIRATRRMPKIYGTERRRSFDFRPLFIGLRVGLFLAIPAVLITLIAVHPALRVRQVEVQAGSLVPAEVIAQAIPKGGHFFSLQRDQITQQILEDHPEISDIQIVEHVPSKVVVSVAEYQPVISWVSGDFVSLLTEDGVVIHQITRSAALQPATEEEKKIAALPRVYDPKSVPVKLVSRIGGPQFVQSVLTVTKELAVAIPTYEIDHLELGDTSYDLVLVAKSGQRVLMDTESDAGVQVRNLAKKDRD